MRTFGALWLRFKIICHFYFQHAAIKFIFQSFRQRLLENRGELVGNDRIGKSHARDDASFRSDKNTVLYATASGYLRPICAGGNFLHERDFVIARVFSSAGKKSFQVDVKRRAVDVPLRNIFAVNFPSFVERERVLLRISFPNAKLLRRADH